MKLMTIALVSIGALSACGSRPQSHYVPPDTPAGRLRTIAYLPFLGSGIAIEEQQKRARDWSEWWNGVYPGTTWLLAEESAKRLADAGLTDTWLAAEKGYLQLGLLPTDLVKQLCAAQQQEGVLQMAIAGVQAGGVTSGWWRPWSWFSGGTPSTARISAVLYSCASHQLVWRHSADLTYQANYTAAQMVDYVQGALWSGIPR
jgi:hypothetical protein